MTLDRHLVVDASALLEMYRAKPDQRLVRRLRTSVAVAPEIIDLEVLHVLRRQARQSPSSADAVHAQVLLLPDAPVTRVSHRGLIERVWGLRHSITAYDAAYVALAELLDVPLATCDAKLAAAHGHKARIELYPLD